MEIKEFATAIAELADIPSEYEHPLLTKIRFIFATDEGARLMTAQAGLKQGIKAEDFDEVIKSAINMPIKMRFLGRRGVGKHLGSVTIGHITGMEKIDLEDDIKALAAEGVLYTSEYPNEVKFLKDAYAAKKAPGVSYEILHDPNKSFIEEGVEWLKGLTTQAATIVSTPAYGNRTAILALASNNELSDEEVADGIRSLVTPKETNEGGSQMDEKDKEVQRLAALAAEKDTALAAKDDELKTLKETLEKAQADLKAATDENAGLKRNILVESRARAYADAGFKFDEDAAKAAAKKDLLAKMEDDVFTAYVDDLKAAHAAKKSTALASASDRGVPRLTAADMEKVMPLDDLKESLRGLSRK